MTTSTEEEFQLILGKLNALEMPTTAGELVAYLGTLSEAVERCEKVVLYLATSPSRSEDLVTYLFQYKQLLNLDRQMSNLRYTLPDKKPGEEPAEPKKKAWWKLG